AIGVIQRIVSAKAFEGFVSEPTRGLGILRIVRIHVGHVAGFTLFDNFDFTQPHWNLNFVLANVHPFLQVFIPVVHIVYAHVLILIVLSARDVGQSARMPLYGSDAADFVIVAWVDDKIPNYVSVSPSARPSAAG